MSASCRSTIIADSIREANGEKVCHSIKQIVDGNRHLAICARMISKPIELDNFAISANGEYVSVGKKIYLGTEIAEIFIASVKNMVTHIIL